jgi:hypothetical protein
VSQTTTRFLVVVAAFWSCAVWAGEALEYSEKPRPDDNFLEARFRFVQPGAGGSLGFSP